MKVLLVSNDIDLSVALQILLREEPKCTVVGSASKIDVALAMIQADCPDLLVLDWDFSGQQAGEMLTLARSMSCHPHVIVIGKHESDEPIAIEAGAEAFVVKGSSPENLISAVRTIYEVTRNNPPHLTEMNEK